MKMMDMCLDERPREKMARLGARYLSTGELLAVLLRTGVVGANAAEVAQELLSMSGGRLCRLCSMSMERLQQVNGVGPGKAAILAAAFELGRRWLAEESDVAKVPVRTAEMAYKAIAPRLRGLDHEEFWVMLLNRANYVIAIEHITTGNLSSTSLDIPRILKMTLDRNATAVIMFHNHPSESVVPGQNDIDATIAMRKALESIEKQLLDHIVVGDSCFYSFALESEVSTKSCGALLSEC